MEYIIYILENELKEQKQEASLEKENKTEAYYASLKNIGEIEKVLGSISESKNNSTSKNSLHKHIVSHCACSVDETTGWTQVKCCNICGKPLKDQNWHCG